MTDAPPIIIDEDAAIDSAFFGSHAGRTCYARAHRSGWVLVVRQAVAQRELPVMIRVWGRVDRMPDDGCQLPGTVGALRQSALTPHGKAVRLFASLCSHHCSARRRKALPIWRGTDGSNPSPSSRESATNRELRGEAARLHRLCSHQTRPRHCSGSRPAATRPQGQGGTPALATSLGARFDEAWLLSMPASLRPGSCRCFWRFFIMVQQRLDPVIVSKIRAF